MQGILQANVENRGLVLDPRTKLLVMLAIVFFALGGVGSEVGSVRMAAGLLSVLPVFLLCTARQWKKALLYGGVFALLSLAQAFVLPGASGLGQSLLAVACISILRLAPGLMMGAYLMSSTTVSEFIAAMDRMHVPQQITIPLSVMFRFFPTVLEEFAAINAAMQMREIRLGGKNAAKLFEYRIIPLLVCSVNIGNELSAAALTRGLGGAHKRTNIARIGFHAQDAVLLAVALLPAALLIWERVRG